MKRQRLREADCDTARENLALIALVKERDAADSGERFTLEQVAERAGIDLDEL